MKCQNCEYALSKEGGCNQKDFEGKFTCPFSDNPSEEDTDYGKRLSRIAKATSVILLVVGLIWGGTAFAQDIDFEKLADAIYLAEGGTKAVKPYGVLRDYCIKGDINGQCRKGCIQTIEKRYRMWSKTGDFISYLSRSYCPIGAKNDPKGLNKNWVRNVTHFYNKEV